MILVTLYTIIGAVIYGFVSRKGQESIIMLLLFVLTWPLLLIAAIAHAFMEQRKDLKKFPYN